MTADQHVRRHHHRHRRRRRHARPPVGPLRQTGPARRARRLPAARAGQLGLHRRVRQGQVPGPGVLARQARQRIPAGGQLLRRRQHQVLRRGAVPAAARRTSASCVTTAASRRPGRSATPTWSRTTPRRSTSTWCTASTARTRRRGRRARSTPSRRCEHEPRIQQLSDDLEKQGLHPFHLPIGVNLTQDEQGRATHASVCIRCDRVDGFPCLVGAKSDAQVICVEPALRAPQCRDDDERPRASGWRPTRPAAASPRSSPSSATARRSAFARTSWSSPAARSTRRRCCCARPTTGTRAGWPTAPTWSAGTTCGTTTWR